MNVLGFARQTYFFLPLFLKDIFESSVNQRSDRKVYTGQVQVLVLSFGRNSLTCSGGRDDVPAGYLFFFFFFFDFVQSTRYIKQKDTSPLQGFST